MKFGESKLARRPQALWLRRALFQVHLWTGLTCGLYVLVMSLSGSAIVFRHEMDHAFCPAIVMVKSSGVRMSDAELARAARRALERRFPLRNTRVEVRGPRVPGAAVEVWYLSERGRTERLLDPYTGRDLGDATACEPRLVSGLVDLHDDLLGGGAGRIVNGGGAVVLALMCLTGLVIWWPGTARWRRSMTLRWNSDWRHFTWDLHSMLGFWTFALLLMWALSGIYLGFPSSLSVLGDLLTAHGADPERIDVLTDWLARLHFGRAFGLPVKVLWTFLGLVPTALLVTGTVMWWNRVLCKTIGRSGAILESTPGATVAVAQARHGRLHVDVR